jgi:hypothetical protein
MPNNQAIDPITDQEIAFARLVLSGTTTDRDAAQAAGLNPEDAAYTKAKLGAYLLDRHATAPQQHVAQDTTEPRRFTITRDQILTRLWEIGAISPEITRGSLAGQVKALSMIAAIEGLIPDRRAASARNQPVPSPVKANIYESEWLRAQRTGETLEPTPEPSPAAPQEEPATTPSSGSTPPTREPIHPPTPALAPRVPMADHVAPDTRVPFSIKPWRR